MDRFERLDEIIARMEGILLILLLSCMILIAFFQIVLRNLFSTGLSGADPLVRNLVLWVGFIGAALAAKEGKHINIDVVSRWIPSRWRTFIIFFIDLFSCLICGLLTYAALKFIKNEAQMGGATFFGISAWIPQIILPITFGLMTFRFCLHCLKGLFITRKISTTHPQREES